MTPHDELDLQLRGWMRRHRTLAPRPGLADDAIAQTVTVRQRPRVLVRTGEPGGLALPLPHVGGRVLLLLGALLVVLLAAIASSGSRPTAMRDPLLVWTARTSFQLVEPDGTVRAGRAVGSTHFRDEQCPRAIPGTTLVAVAERFAGMQLTDVIGDAGTVAAVPFSGYAGTEYFALEGPRLVLFELDAVGETGAAVTVVDLADPPTTPRQRVEAPGVAAAAVDATGRWLALATTGGGRTALEIVDLRSGKRRSVGTIAGTIAPSALPGTVLSIAPDGAHVAAQLDPVDVPSEFVIIDVATGLSRALGAPNGIALADLAWSPDGRWLAVPQRETLRILKADGRKSALFEIPSPRHLAWSPDGSRLAFGRGGGGLVTVDPDGSPLVSRPINLDGFLWAPDGTLAVARTSDDGHDMILERYRADESVPFERIGSLPIPGNEDTSDGFEVALACLSWSTRVEP